MIFGTRGMSKLVVDVDTITPSLFMRVEGNDEGKFYADSQMQEEVGRYLMERQGFTSVKASYEDVDMIDVWGTRSYECGGETVRVDTPVEELRLRAAQLLRIADHKDKQADNERAALLEEFSSQADFEEAALNEILRLRKELEKCATSK